MSKRKKSSKNKIRKKSNRKATNKVRNSEPKTNDGSATNDESAINQLNRKSKWARKIASGLITLIAIPVIITQGLNIYNTNKAAEEALQATIQQIYINYGAGNYSAMEKDIYNVFPQLQKKKDYKTLVSLSDMLLGSLYQEFYSNRLALPKEQEELILLYANNALHYAEELKDTTNYIKICVHLALFNISEYEFTLNQKYLDNADIALNTAGEYFDKNHTPELFIMNESDANLAIQFFNLKNLQYQVLYYRVTIGYPFDNSLENLDQETTLGPTIEESDLYKLIDDLGAITIKFIGTVYIIEDQNTTLGLIQEEIIQHMKILAGVAYIKSGNLIHNYGDILPLVLRGGETPDNIFDYNNIDLCTDLFNTLEEQAINIKDYEDLFKIYKSAETYYFLNYVSTGSDDALAKYNDVVGKLLELDPSGEILSSHIINPGDSSVLDKYIEVAENKLSEIKFGSDPFAFSLLKYDLGTNYLYRALHRDKLGDITNANLDYENARKCYSTALLYFKQENKYIFEEIQRMQDLITERLSTNDPEVIFSSSW